MQFGHWRKAALDNFVQDKYEDWDGNAGPASSIEGATEAYSFPINDVPITHGLDLDAASSQEPIVYQNDPEQEPTLGKIRSSAT